MPLTLKMKCQGEVRRLKVQDGDKITYEYIREKIQAAFPEVGPRTTKYFDDEGDLCTLCSSTFEDFLSLADSTTGQTVLKIEILPAAMPDVALLQPGEAQQAPPVPADDMIKATTEGLREAAKAMQKPEVQQAMQSLQGVKGLEGLHGLRQTFAQPGVDAAASLTSSATAGSRAWPGNGMQGLEELQHFFRTFEGGARRSGQPQAYDGGAAAPPQPGEAEQAPPFPADDMMKAMTEGLQEAAQAMQQPEVQKAMGNLQGMKGFESFQSCFQAISKPVAGAATSTTASASSSFGTGHGNGTQGFEGLEHLFRAFEGGAGGNWQPSAYDGGAAAPPQPGEAQQAPPFAADEKMKAMTEGLQEAAQAMQRPEVRAAMESLQGCFQTARPVVGAATNAAVSATAGSGTWPGNGTFGLEGLQHLFQAFDDAQGSAHSHLQSEQASQDRVPTDKDFDQSNSLDDKAHAQKLEERDLSSAEEPWVLLEDCGEDRQLVNDSVTK